MKDLESIPQTRIYVKLQYCEIDRFVQEGSQTQNAFRFLFGIVLRNAEFVEKDHHRAFHEIAEALPEAEEEEKDGICQQIMKISRPLCIAQDRANGLPPKANKDTEGQSCQQSTPHIENEHQG